MNEELEVIGIPKYPVESKVNEITSRFSGAIWYDNIQKQEVTLAGLGGIGSYVNFLLSRLNVKQLYIYDSDIVEEGNLSGQLYSKKHIGIKKTSASFDIISDFSNYTRVYAYDYRYTSTSPASKVMICGFDNMEARKIYFNNWLELVRNTPEEERKKCLFIDGRLNMEYLQVLCIRGDDIYNICEYKKDFLFSDDEAESPVCSMKQTSFMANMIGSLIVNLFVNFCANDLEGENKPIIPRDLPFYTEYNAETMYFKTKA